MNKKILMTLGLPITIENDDGKKATIELNQNEFVVCRFDPDNSVYLHDAQLNDWYPSSINSRMRYLLNSRFSKYH